MLSQTEFQRRALKRFDADIESVVRTLNREKIDFRENGKDYGIKICPFCPTGTDEPSNQYKLYIRKLDGVFHCFRCKSKGTWFQFLQKIGHAGISSNHAASTITFDTPNQDE